MADKFQNRLAWAAIGGFVMWLLLVIGAWLCGQALIVDEAAHQPSEWRAR